MVKQLKESDYYIMEEKEKNITAPNFLTEKQRNLIDREIAEKYVKLTPDGFKYINSAIVIEILNQVFDYAWSWTILDQGIEQCRPYPKHPTIEGSYAWVKGQITAPFNNSKGEIFNVIKQALGGKMIIGGPKVQSQVFKTAATDAFKKAASFFGIAKNIYMAEDLFLSLQEDKIEQDSWNTFELKQHEDAIAKINSYKEVIGAEELSRQQMIFCDESGLYTIRGEITPINVEDFALFLENVYSSAILSNKKANKNPLSRA